MADEKNELLPMVAPLLEPVIIAAGESPESINAKANLIERCAEAQLKLMEAEARVYEARANAEAAKGAASAQETAAFFGALFDSEPVKKTIDGFVMRLNAQQSAAEAKFKADNELERIRLQHESEERQRQARDRRWAILSFAVVVLLGFCLCVWMLSTGYAKAEHIATLVAMAFAGVSGHSIAQKNRQ